jgi:hypothetical protein
MWKASAAASSIGTRLPAHLSGAGNKQCRRQTVVEEALLTAEHTAAAGRQYHQCPGFDRQLTDIRSSSEHAAIAR